MGALQDHLASEPRAACAPEALSDQLLVLLVRATIAAGHLNQLIGGQDKFESGFVRRRFGDVYVRMAVHTEAS
ncbi:hypothetical protein NS331_24795 [Pseudacidovorax intermedius]|uniref:Uncharacterized protein n=1 Tax=Pseudacidovorax intermedius TaxID=433924 RepID=A0A147GL07_9BURK|nr:hypothetical protein NS331_24795 [Pseudacidovorax intermedius]